MLNIKKIISIRTFFQLFLAVSVIVPLMILGGIGLFISSDILRRELTESNTRQIGLIAGHLEQYLEVPYENLKILSDLFILEAMDGEDLKQAVLKSFTDKYDNIKSIQIADLSGKVIMLYPSNDFFLGSDISGHDYFQQAVETNEPYWAPSYMSDQTDAPVTTLSLPYRDGVITAVLSLEKINTIVENSKFISSDLVLYATDQNGVYISHPDNEKVLLQEYDSFFIKNKFQEYDVEEIREYNNVLYLSYREVIENSNWNVVLLQPVNTLNEPVKAMAYSLMMLTVLIILIALLSGTFLRRYFTIPLNELIYSTRGISEGLYDLTVPDVNFHELSLLAESIRKMSEEIRKREEALEKARTYLNSIIDSMPSVLIGVDIDMHIIQWNRQAEIFTGLSLADVSGKPLVEIIPRMTDEIPRIKLSIDNKEMQEEHKHIYFTNGERIIENITIFPVIASGANGAVIRIDDVTKKVMMEEIIIQNEKMLSVGGLAAGMAHEINNPLAGMIQTVNVLANRLGLNRNLLPNREAAEKAAISLDSLSQYLELRDIPNMIDSINVSGKRISSIVKNMLSFVRNSEESVSSHDINKILNHSLELAETDYNLKKNFDFKNIIIIREYDLDLPMVLCEKTKIQQVFFNILQNAAHAMNDGGNLKSVLIIRTYYEEDINMIVIEFEDNGPGIEKSIQNRIFEPFFTTKPVGIGTGLGLSVSYFIITESQKGLMSVETQPGRGAKFIIKLPACIPS